MSRIKLLGRRVSSGAHVIRESSDGDSIDVRVTVAAPPSMSRDEVNEWVYNRYMTYCRHSYDCCGHWYTTVWTHKTIRVKSGAWSVVFNYSRNV